MGKKENFFIKDGYITNPVQTYNTEGIDHYWTDERIQNSHLFQYHVYEFAKEIFLKSQLSSVVDIGAGPGTKMKLFFSAIADDIAIIDQPTTEAAARKVFPQANFFPANLEDERFTLGRKFDMVICSDVIEHLANPDALLQIIKNHMKKSGFAIISTPDRELRWGKHANQSPNIQHVREWNGPELREYLENSGFAVVAQKNFPLKKLQPLTFRISRLPFLYRNVKQSSWFPNQALLLKKRTKIAE